MIEFSNFVVKLKMMPIASGTGHFGYARYQRTIREGLLYRRADNSCGKIKADIS